MVNVDKAQLTADLLKRCCVGIETMRRRETSDSARRQDQNQRKIDLERKLMETKCLEENKLEMSQALLVTRLQVSKNQLEQVVSTTSTKGKDVEEEVKTLHIYRRDLIQEICDIDQKISQKAAAIEGNTPTNQCSKEEQADQEVLAGLKELSRHNLDKLHKKQKCWKIFLSLLRITPARYFITSRYMRNSFLRPRRWERSWNTVLYPDRHEQSQSREERIEVMKILKMNQWMLNVQMTIKMASLK